MPNRRKQRQEKKRSKTKKKKTSQKLERCGLEEKSDDRSGFESCQGGASMLDPETERSETEDTVSEHESENDHCGKYEGAEPDTSTDLGSDVNINVIKSSNIQIGSGNVMEAGAASDDFMQETSIRNTERDRLVKEDIDENNLGLQANIERKQNSERPLVEINVTSDKTQIGTKNIIVDSKNGQEAQTEGLMAKTSSDRNTNSEFFRRDSSKDGVNKLDVVTENLRQTIFANKVENNVYIQKSESGIKGNAETRDIFALPDLETFLKHVGNFEQGNYILITDQINSSLNMKSFSLVPWIAVFDFDQKSQHEGLLSKVEQSIKTKRFLHLLTWQDKLKISGESTSWIFPKGYNESPDSVINDDVTDWIRKVKKNLELQFDEIDILKGTTNITFVVLLPGSAPNARYIKRFLNLIENSISPNMVFITERDASEDVENCYHSIKDIKEHQHHLSKFTFSLIEVCNIISIVCREEIDLNANLKLPTSVPGIYKDLSPEDATFLTENLEVLFTERNNGKKYDSESIREEEDLFFKGGTLPWDLLYYAGPEFIPIRRDKMEKIIKYIERVRKDDKSKYIKLYHAPGSGGSTLAQRVIWEFKDKMPCAQLKDDIKTVEDLESQIKIISDRTGLPTLLLIDGHDQETVDMIKLHLKELNTIIIHVQRYPHNMNDEKKHCDRDGKFWLKSGISLREAVCLHAKYAKFCETQEKAKYLEKLEKAAEKGDVSIFEFGLAVHSYKYQGIYSYVKGYLGLSNKENQKDWHTCLGYLALAYYYGQCGLPCQFFAKMLSRDSTPFFNFSNLPEEMRELTVKDRRGNNFNVVRINHYFVAKEILNQILVSSDIMSKGRSTSSELLPEAKARLCRFAISFIEEAAKMSESNSDTHIYRVLTQIFVKRDGKLMLNQSDRKMKFSFILENVTQDPPYTERFEIMKKLTKSFPQDPEAVSHLGRLYRICCPEKGDDARSCFENAIDLCDVKGLPKAQISLKKRKTLMHIYHMYGGFILDKCFEYSRYYRRDEKDLSHETGMEMKSFTKEACFYFEMSREYAPDTSDGMFGCFGEIKARVEFCCFLKRLCGHENFMQYLEDVCSEKMAESNQSQLARYAVECITMADDLFLNYQDSAKIKESKFDLIKQYNKLAGAILTKNEMRSILQTKGVELRRMQISECKMKTLKPYEQLNIDLISDKDDILLISQNYKHILSCAPVPKNPREGPIDSDYRGWLSVIRHRLFSKTYDVEEVLLYVRRWHETQNTPFSLFYLFVITSLLGIGVNGQNGNFELLSEAQGLKEEIERSREIKQFKGFPKEALGSSQNGIKCLVSKRWEHPYNAEEFKIMTGTIIPTSESPNFGYISLDVRQKPDITVKVFFVPKLANLVGKRYFRRRVEFCLEFNKRGYNAIHVKLIQTLLCRKCGNGNVEIKSCETSATCPSCRKILFKY